MLVRAADRLALSARAYHRVLRVARTIADLDGIDVVTREHVGEALCFRPTSRESAQLANDSGAPASEQPVADASVATV